MRLPRPTPSKDKIDRVNLYVTFRLSADKLANALSLNYKFKTDQEYSHSQIHQMVMESLAIHGEVSMQATSTRYEIALKQVRETYQFSGST